MFGKAHWSLALKGAVFGAGWLLFPGWLFVPFALLLYLKPLFRPGKLVRSFVVLLGIAFGASFLAPELAMFASGAGYFFAAYLGGLFVLLLGIKDLVFSNRAERYLLLYGCQFFGVFTLSFWYAVPLQLSQLLLISLLLFAASLLLFREFLGLLYDELLLGAPGAEGAAVWDEKRRRRALVWTLTLLTLELFWAIRFLPIGFLMQSALLLLFVIAGSVVLREHLQGALTRRAVLRAVTAVLFAALAIFAASRWEL